MASLISVTNKSYKTQSVINIADFYTESEAPLVHMMRK